MTQGTAIGPCSSSAETEEVPIARPQIVAYRTDILAWANGTVVPVHDAVADYPRVPDDLGRRRTSTDLVRRRSRTRSSAPLWLPSWLPSAVPDRRRDNAQAIDLGVPSGP